MAHRRLCASIFSPPHCLLALTTVCIGSLATAQVLYEDYQLISGDAASQQQLGSAVAISGGRAVIGASGDDGFLGNNAGAAYIFDVKSGIQLHKLIASDGTAFDQLGAAVAISDDAVLVGAPFDDGPDASGSAYLFRASTGEQFARLRAADTAAGDLFGSSVAVTSRVAAVGAPNASSGAGAVYLFDIGTGEQIRKFVSGTADPDDLFGCAVAMSGTALIVGAFGDDDRANNAGAVYIFNVDTGEQLYKLTASDATPGDWFGRAVAAFDEKVIVGAPESNSIGYPTGSAYVFDLQTGAQIHKLTAAIPGWNDQFGISVSISGSIAVVGASLADYIYLNTGSAYVFDIVSGQQVLQLVASDHSIDDTFGGAVAVSGSVALTGSMGSDDSGPQSGSAYLYFISFSCNPADLADPWGTLDLSDVNAFVGGFGASDDVADLTGDGLLDLEDIIEFLSAFAAGCP